MYGMQVIVEISLVASQSGHWESTTAFETRKEYFRGNAVFF